MFRTDTQKERGVGVPIVLLFSPLQSHLNWSTSVTPEQKYAGLKRYIPQWLKIKLSTWMHFSPRDYLGYLKLSRRLKKERKNFDSY